MLRKLTVEDFTFTDKDILRAMQELDQLARSPRPFGTFNPINLLCAICQQEVESFGEHRCAAMIACSTCGEIHPIQMRSC
jgi:hypothetical protein